MKNKETNYDIKNTNSTIDKYVQLNERDKRIKHKIKNGIITGAMIVSLLVPTNKCKSPESPPNHNGTTTYALTVTNKNIMDESSAGGNIQVNGVWQTSGSAWEIDAVNGIATIQSINVDTPGYNHSYITGTSGDEVTIIKDREGPHQFQINRNMTLDTKLIPDSIDTRILAGLIGKDSDQNEIGDGVVYRFSNEIPTREVGIKRANENGQEPTPTIKKYLRECVDLVNECNGQQLKYIGEISTAIDKGVTHLVRDGRVGGALVLNEDEGKITRSGFYTPNEVPKYTVLEELFQVSTGIFWDNGSPNSPLIRIVGGDASNPEILARGKTYADLIKRLPHLFKLSINQVNPAAYTEQVMSPTTRPWGAPKDYHEFADPSQPGQRHQDNATRNKKVKRDYHKIRK